MKNWRFVTLAMCILATLACGVKEVPEPTKKQESEAVPAGGEEHPGWDRSRHLLESGGASIELVKLALTPDTAARFGANEFHAFGFKMADQTLLLYVFEYKSGESAVAFKEKVAATAAEEGLVHNGATTLNENLLLVAGTEGEAAPSAEAKSQLAAFSKLFAGK